MMIKEKMQIVIINTLKIVAKVKITLKTTSNKVSHGGICGKLSIFLLLTAYKQKRIRDQARQEALTELRKGFVNHA